MNYIKAKNIIPREKRFYEYQRKICSWTNIKKILLDIQKLPEDIKSKIRLKDSIRNHKKYHTLTSKPRTSECDITRCIDTGDKDLKGRSNRASPSRQTNDKEKCPNCDSEDIAWSGTTIGINEYTRACNKCGYVWNHEEVEKN